MYRNPNPRMGPKIQVDAPAFREKQWVVTWHHIRDTLVVMSSSCRSLGVLSLRSDVSQQKRFRCLDFDFDIRNFFVDVSQDLLVLVEHGVGARLHFRSFRTGQAHPTLRSLHDNDMPIPQSEFPTSIRRWDTCSIWHEWMVVCFESWTHRIKRLYHWPSGTLSKVIVGT